MSDHVTINRDPFAREQLVRRVCDDWTKSVLCDWCGGTRQRDRVALALFEYGIEPDSISGRVNWIKGRYCGVDCMRAHQPD